MMETLNWLKLLTHELLKKRKGVPKLSWERGCELSTNVVQKGGHHSLRGTNLQKENGVSFGKVLRRE
jgi:hypothetical protein